jgi:hypothetical protein
MKRNGGGICGEGRKGARWVVHAALYHKSKLRSIGIFYMGDGLEAICASSPGRSLTKFTSWIGKSKS